LIVYVEYETGRDLNAFTTPANNTQDLPAYPMDKHTRGNN